MTRRTVVFGVFLLVAVPILALFGLRAYDKEVARLRTEEGYSVFMKVLSPRPAAAAFALKNLRGEKESLSGYAGKVVFLNFRTTW
jgi:hypothetical protein